MAHDTHFLDRLSRIDVLQTELALGLYRDPELIRFMLSRARIPDGSSRVALSLDSETLGPFIVVGRDGRFVTCLGEGMATDLPVVSRAELDSLAERHEKVQERVGRARQAVEVTPARRLFRSLLFDGPALCREDFVTALDLVPIFGKIYMNFWVTATNVVARELPQVAARAEKARRRGKMQTSDAFRVWNAIWTVAHTKVLLRDYTRTLADIIPEEDLPSLVKGHTAEIALSAVIGPSLHTLWTYGRLGRNVLGPTKRAHATAKRGLRWLASALCLGALGFRNEKMRAEVRKAIGVRPVFIEQEVAPQVLDVVQAQLETLLAHPAEDVGAACIDICREAWWRTLGRLDPDHGGLSSPEEIPADVAPAYLARLGIPLRANATLSAFLPLGLGFYARAEAPTLFVPRDLLPRLRVANDPVFATETLAASAESLRTPPTVAERTPGRNELCPCGSGRKYKRCCLDS